MGAYEGFVMPNYIMFSAGKLYGGIAYALHMSEVAHPTTIALPMKSPKMCRGVSHTPFMAAKRHVRRG